jgi:hypothetical protein
MLGMWGGTSCGDLRPCVGFAADGIARRASERPGVLMEALLMPGTMFYRAQFAQAVCAMRGDAAYDDVSVRFWTAPDGRTQYYRGGHGTSATRTRPRLDREIRVGAIDRPRV